MDKEKYMRAIIPAMSLVIKKHEDYNSKGVSLQRYFPFEDKSYVQMIHLKALRAVSLVENATPNFDSMQDTLYDLLNYTVFYLDYLKEQSDEHI